MHLYQLKKALQYLRHYGPQEFFVRCMDRFFPSDGDYTDWYSRHRPSTEELQRQRDAHWDQPPLISVAVPLYRTPPAFLAQMVESVRTQTYPHWELVLANGSPEDEDLRKALAAYKGEERIKIYTLPKNLGIAGNTNAALSACTGACIGLLDHDDLLAPDALFEVAKAIKETGAEVVYTDEDKVSPDVRKHFLPNVKPDFNQDLLCANNYICHFLVVSRKLAGRVGGFDAAYDGAQDYDFVLRCTEQAKKVAHVPKILYHWRTSAGSTSDNPISKQYAYEAGRRAIAAHLERLGIQGEVSLRKEFGYYRVNYPVLGEPLVSVIVEAKEPFGNSSENASKKVKEYCDRLVQMLQKAGYEHFEVLVPVFSVEIPEKMESLKEIDRRNRIRVVYCDKNRETLSFPGELVADKAKGEVLCFLDAKVCDVSNGWMRELLGTVLRPGVGVAAGCVRDKNGRIVQAGYSLYNKEETRPDFAGLKKGHTGYMNRADLQRDVFAGASVLVVRREACLAVAVTGEAAVAVAKAAAVTGEAAVAVTKAAAVTGEAAVAVTKAEAVTGKTASGEAADIALCARLQKAGWRICYTPYVAVTVEEK